MNSRWLIAVVLVVSSLGTQAQNDFLFSHYMFNPAYFNPGWGGSERQGFVAFQHRTQWLGYNTTFDGSGGNPSTQMLTGMIPFKNSFISSAGFTIANDNLGPVNNLRIQLPVSYSRSFRRGSFSIGVAPSLFSQTLKADELRFNDPTDPIREALSGDMTEIQPDLAAGVFFTFNNGLFFGASALNILQPGFDFGQSTLENKQQLSFAVHGGYSFQVNNNLSISPSVLVRSDLLTYTFDVGAIATLNQKMWAGLSYRREEAIIAYLGYSLLEDNRLKVGYSFDYVLEGQQAKSATTHEIFVRYDLPDLVFGGKKAVKTPRFSY